MKTADQSIRGGTEPSLKDWDTLKAHPLLAPGVAKAKWAERHLATLQNNIEQAFTLPESRPELRADLDPESGYHVFRIRELPPVDALSEHFTNTVADVVGNLRSALDKLAWQLAVSQAGGIDPPDPTGVRFPICDCRTKAECERAFSGERRARKQIEAAHWGFIESFQPYHGVDGRADGWTGPYIHQLALLRDFSNDDKHRLTSPVLLIPNQFELVAFEVVYTTQTIGDQTFPYPDWEFQVGGELQLNGEVFRARLVDGTEPHIENAGQFTPQVALAEGRHAVSTLDRGARFVQLIFSEFSRRFP